MGNVLSRFASYQTLSLVVDLATSPVGYDQPITGAGVQSPLLVNQDPAVGIFTRDLSLPVSAIGVGKRAGYIPAYILSGAAGHGLFGGGAIGHCEPYHGTLVATIVNGFTVYVPLGTLEPLLGQDGAILLGRDGAVLLGRIA